MHFLTWDIGVLAALGLLLAYTLLIAKHKALTTLVSLYIAYLMSVTWGDKLAAFFAGNRVFLNQVWIQANASSFLVESVLLVLITLILTALLKLGGKRSKYSSLEVVVYVICTVALAVTFILSFMTPAGRDAVLHTSTLLPYIYAWRELILGIPVIAIILFGLYGNED